MASSVQSLYTIMQSASMQAVPDQLEKNGYED